MMSNWHDGEDRIDSMMLSIMSPMFIVGVTVWSIRLWVSQNITAHHGSIKMSQGCVVRLGNDDDVLDINDGTEVNECVWSMFRIQNTKPLAISKAMIMMSISKLRLCPCVHWFMGPTSSLIDYKGWFKLKRRYVIRYGVSLFKWCELSIKHTVPFLPLKLQQLLRYQSIYFTISTTIQCVYHSPYCASH